MASELLPYVGPAPFKREDEPFFFGRDREGNELVSLIISHSEVLLYAQSGAGKTSLINAKLRTLFEREDLEVLPLARVQGPPLLPSSKITNIYVFNTLVKWAPKIASAEELVGMTLCEFLKRREQPIDKEGLPKPCIAIFDQFEELFTSYPECWEQRRDFFIQVRDALDTHSRIRALFAMREDYVAAIDQYATIMPEKFRVRFHLENLRKDQAKEAIEGPLTLGKNRHFAEGVAQKLVEELMTVQVQTAGGRTEAITGEFVEPVQLQVVCDRIWRDLKPEDTEITLAHLEAISVEKALLSFYEESIEDVGRETGIDKSALRSWFETKLVTPARTRGMVFRGETETAGMRNDAVDAFDMRHLIRSELRHGQRWYELTHDRFVDAIQASYQRILLSLEAGAEETRSQLEAKAVGWVSLGRKKSELLHDDELHKAQGWLNSPAAKALGSSEALRALVEASYAEVQARSARRRKALSFVLGAACLITLLMAVVALEQSAKAKRQTQEVENLQAVLADIFRPMDDGIQLAPEEIVGRNTWILWSGGNQHFWNQVAQDSLGGMDLLKMLDNRKYPRGERFISLGVMNEPGFRAASKPDEYGLSLDEQIESEPAGIDEKTYGKPSGVLGFRLFPNPDFNDRARKKWDGERFMNDPAYYRDNALVRPYRVGVSCAACHLGPNPANPPIDRENPRWENLASAIGNQYIREGTVFACEVDKGSFLWEEFGYQPRGTSDISRIATDNINNPTAINPIFLLGERSLIATQEKMSGGTLFLPGEKEDMAVPHILMDGADSIGVPGAMLRAYVNIGMFSEYWLTLHNPLIGLAPQRPFDISYARQHSGYWRATEERLSNISSFFRRLRPFRLADAPFGASYITTDQAILTRGKEVFAESCAVCHSSKQPPRNIDPRSGEGKAWFRAAVMDPYFLENNLLSNDKRYSVTEIETNSARAFDTNAMAGHIWANFSSQTYKELPPPGEIELYNPFDETHPIKFRPKSKHNGPGYYRVPSLVSLWSSAPFLHNNALGKYTSDPSVQGRMEAYNDAVEKLLWPEKRLGKDSIRRTQNECTLYLRKEYLPKPLQALADNDGYVKLGPIPKGTPIDLFANLEPDVGQAAALTAKIMKALQKIHAMNLPSEQATAELIKAVPELLAANKCPDFIEDKGHYFGTDLPDSDKRALIEYMKTF